MSAAFDSNVTLTIELGFGDGPLEASPSWWTDISTYSRGFDIRRGRASVDSTFQSGTAVVLLDNRDGRFDPNNSSSPYSPNVKLGVPVKITATYSATPYALFYGHVNAWPLSYPQQGKDAVVSLSCVENMRLLGTFDLVDQTYSAESTDTRIGNVLDDVGWPAGARNIDTFGVDVQASDFTDTSRTALSHLQQVEQAEQGSLFVARDGDLTFYNRVQWAGGPASTATFGAGNIEYADLSVAYDDDFLFNKATMTGESGDPQTASDATSISDHGPRTQSASNDLLTDNESLNIAEWIVGSHKTVQSRVTGLTVLPQSVPTDWGTLLGLELRQAVTVTVDPIGGGTDLNQLVTIEGISHTVRPKVWSIGLSCHPLSSLEQSDFWILGTSDDLDTDTVLA